MGKRTQHQQTNTPILQPKRMESTALIMGRTAVVTNASSSTLQHLQVGPPASSSGGDESDTAHLRIVDPVTPAPTDFIGTRTRATAGGSDYGAEGSYRRFQSKVALAKLSIVAVGGRVSILGHEGGVNSEVGKHERGEESAAAGVDHGDGGDGRVAGYHGGKEKAAAEAAPDVTFGVQDLILLQGELLLQGDGGGEQKHRGLEVKRSARLRTATVSAISGEVGADDAAAASGVVGASAAADGIVGTRDEHGSSSSAGVTLGFAGEVKLDEAWEPKPFFVGTTLSQILSSLSPSPGRAWEEDQEEEEEEEVTDGHGGAWRAPEEGVRGRGGGGVVDGLMFDGVVVDLAGESIMRGNVTLVGTALVQVCVPYTMLLPQLLLLRLLLLLYVCGVLVVSIRCPSFSSVIYVLATNVICQIQRQSLYIL